MLKKTFNLFFFVGFLAGIPLFILLKTLNMQSADVPDLNTKSLSLHTDIIPLSSSGDVPENRLPLKTPILAQRLNEYARLSPDEIKRELEIINNRMQNQFYAMEISPEIIPIYYLINKWTKTSPINASNLKNKNKLEDTISFFYHVRLNSYMWNVKVETGKNESSSSCGEKKEDF